MLANGSCLVASSVVGSWAVVHMRPDSVEVGPVTQPLKEPL